MSSAPNENHYTPQEEKDLAKEQTSDEKKAVTNEPVGEAEDLVESTKPVGEEEMKVVPMPVEPQRVQQNLERRDSFEGFFGSYNVEMMDSMQVGETSSPTESSESSAPALQVEPNSPEIAPEDQEQANDEKLVETKKKSVSKIARGMISKRGCFGLRSTVMRLKRNEREYRSYFQKLLGTKYEKKSRKNLRLSIKKLAECLPKFNHSLTNPNGTVPLQLQQPPFQLNPYYTSDFLYATSFYGPLNMGQQLTGTSNFEYPAPSSDQADFSLGQNTFPMNPWCLIEPNTENGEGKVERKDGYEGKSIKEEVDDASYYKYRWQGPATPEEPPKKKETVWRPFDDKGKFPSFGNEFDADAPSTSSATLPVNDYSSVSALLNLPSDIDEDESSNQEEKEPHED